MKVHEYMSSPVVAVPESATLEHVRNLMVKNRISRVLVVEGSKPVGIVTHRDIAKLLADGGAPWRRRPPAKQVVSRVMSRELLTVDADAEVQEASAMMLEHGISSLPVMRGEELAGIITATDLLRAYMENMEGMHRVEEVMTPQVITANPDHTLVHVLELMEKHRITRVVICEGASPVGIVTARDLSLVEVSDPVSGVKSTMLRYVRKDVPAGRARRRYVKRLSLITAGEVMSTPLITTSPEEDCATAAERMLEHGISSLPVVSDNALKGVVTKRDIIRAMAGG
ncbi:MAG: CBS domain-containing protein [Euryarchaeota archaeon]|nr:CBS domain-containing protein [Euryarchaeota archaeon]